MGLSSKNIMQVCLSPSWGGLEMVAYEFARDFKSQGVDLRTLCIESSPLSLKLQELKLSVVHLPAKGVFSKMISFDRIIRQESPDIILCQHLHDLWYMIPAIYFKKVRAIGLSHTFLGVSKKDPFHSLLYRRLDCMICMTGLHKENLLKYLSLSEDKFEVIPNMVDVTRFTPENRSSFLHKKYKLSKKKILVGIVGRLDEHKGQREAILAVKKLRQYNEQIHLLIIGEDTINNPGTEKILKTLVKEHHLESMVTFTGHMNGVEKAMASLDILLVPSRAETFGRAIIEGMASGVPVISTRAGGVPDIIINRQTGMLVEPGNIQDLAGAIEKLIRSPALREHIRSTALCKARSIYSREVIEQKLKAVFLAS